VPTTPQLFLLMLNNADIAEYTVRRDQDGWIVCKLGEVSQSRVRFDALIRGARSFVFWHKNGFLKKLNRKFQKEIEQNLRHIISPASALSPRSNEFKRDNTAHYYIRIKINPEATIAEIREWLLTVGFTVEIIVHRLLEVDENSTLNTIATQQEQIQRAQVADAQAARSRQEQLEMLGEEFEELGPTEKKIPEFTEYIKSLPDADADKKKIFAGFDKKVKSIQAQEAGNKEKCAFTVEEIILQAGSLDKYIMILTYDDKNDVNPYNVSFFLPDPNAKADSLESSEKIIQYLSTLKDVIDPATGLPALASNPVTGRPIYVLDPTTKRPIYTIDPDTGDRVKTRAVIKQHSDPNGSMKIVALATGTYDELSKMMHDLLPTPTVTHTSNEDEGQEQRKSLRSISSKPRLI
jgi:hypothetical protein